MSCNGCRVLRKGCNDSCIIRPCLQWIERPEAQGNATVFVAKFFGRARLMSFISAVPIPQRPALFKSLLFEACGRTINPVSGAVGLLCTDNWHLCQAAVETVLRGGSLRSLVEITRDSVEGVYEEVEGEYKRALSVDRMPPPCDRSSIPSDMDKSVNIVDDDRHDRQPRIMNLFV